MDKLKSKELFRLHNVPTPPYYVYDQRHAEQSIVDIHGSFGFPVVVKPRREGSSIGVSRANSLAELEEARDNFKQHAIVPQKKFDEIDALIAKAKGLLAK